MKLRNFPWLLLGRGLILTIAAAIVVSSSAYGQQSKTQKFEGLLNKLLAPGPLIKGHQSLEHKDCLKCHEPAGGVPNKKCLDCHKEIKSMVAKNEGFHGKMKNKDCFSCHTDHKGRNFNNMPLNEKTFNHNQTSFSLTGAHQKTKCRDCHTQKRSDRVIRKNETRFFKVQKTCNSCHKPDDIHFFKGKYATTSCSKCHSTNSWKQNIKFNHTTDAGYALKGNHAKLSCKKCHVSTGKNQVKYNFNVRAQKCLSCHKNHHKQNISPKFTKNCDSCHNQFKWPITNFDHKITGFPLVGSHTKVACKNCHTQTKLSLKSPDFKFTGNSKQCASCHQDYHGYADRISSTLGPLKDCKKCHTEVSFKKNQSFNHNTQTRFALTGKHLKNKCFDCHKPTKKGKPQQYTKRRYFFKHLTTKTCETCHKDPHPDSFHRKAKGKKCSSCHNPSGWRNFGKSASALGRGFHDTTRFPLTGSHKAQSCNSCHVRNGKEIYKFNTAKQGFCISCHTSVHKKQFSPKFVNKPCKDCHTTDKFSQRKAFNHDTTKFKLTGSHAKIENKCFSCHKLTNKMLPTKPPKQAHKFRFNGGNRGYCENCHTNPHKKQFTPKFYNKPCTTCHTPAKFSQRKPFNHGTTRFKLTGRHQKIKNKCFKCHTLNGKNLMTKPPKKGHKFKFPNAKKNFCESCHKNEHKDMFHKKFYKKPCTSCHTTKAFTPQPKFDHDDSSFALKGKHKKVKCVKCHTKTKKRFKAPPQNKKGKFLFPERSKKNCQTCHTDPHKGANGTKCFECHSEDGFEAGEGFHRNFTLNGVHMNLDCKQCHGNGLKLRQMDEDCSFCHHQEDIHNGTQQDCSQCHSQTFWNAVTYDHSTNMFPLVGAHRITDCRSCHGQGTYLGLPTGCETCHQADAAPVTTPDHSSLRFQDCSQCHNQFNFKGASP